MVSLLRGAAFVTGAGSGIGQYTAFALARYGVKQIAIADINPVSLRSTLEQLKSRNANVEILPLELDVSSESSIDQAISTVVSQFGRLDYAINNAGIAGPAQASTDFRPSEWQKLLDVNLTGVWLCQRPELRQMMKQQPLHPDDVRQGRGVIVNVASMLGLVASSPNTPATAYTASKHGVLGLTKTDAVMYAPHGIRLNAICPGYVETPLLKAATQSGIMAKEIEKVPMGRLAKMEEIADSIVYLASPLSSYMTGSGLVVDGGYTCQ
ncbi:hypothetical protein B0A49_08618 [Cryomyces minteri]|uniref:3-oxoacyl-[acyl-carrier-protein] reductase FabG n=1 Tax=Cryomyces minteri TaxID=331657 RepID=A0A4U0WNF3_9PEZI|nr:hypothetical protein B0A49_08618 [Cryomyces minteri]